MSHAKGSTSAGTYTAMDFPGTAAFPLATHDAEYVWDVDHLLCRTKGDEPAPRQLVVFTVMDHGAGGDGSSGSGVHT